jgi:hypothetical protein
MTTSLPKNTEPDSSEDVSLEDKLPSNPWRRQDLSSALLMRPVAISHFRSNYVTVLTQVDEEGFALISRAGKRYVVISEEQVVRLANMHRSNVSVADVLRSLPAPTQPVQLTAAQMAAGADGIVLPPKKSD